jgi:dsRNA-specific ribonuclease
VEVEYAGRVWGEGSSFEKRAAEQAASKRALEALGALTQDEALQACIDEA